MAPQDWDDTIADNYASGQQEKAQPNCATCGIGCAAIIVVLIIIGAVSRGCDSDAPSSASSSTAPELDPNASPDAVTKSIAASLNDLARANATTTTSVGQDSGLLISLEPGTTDAYARQVAKDTVGIIANYQPKRGWFVWAYRRQIKVAEADYSPLSQRITVK